VLFLLVFNVLQRAFPTFVFVKKLALRPLFLLGFFMGCLGWLCFADSARILLYLVGFFYAGTVFFVFFAGGFGNGLQAVDAFRGFGVVFVAEAGGGEAVGSQVVFVFAHQGEFLPEVFELAGAGAVEEGAVL